MDYTSLIFAMMISMLGKMNAQSYRSPDPECVSVPPQIRQQCGFPGISIPDCLRVYDSATDRYCCYDNTVGIASALHCYWTALDTPAPGSLIPSEEPQGFVPPTQGPQGFVPSTQGPSGFVPPGFAPPGFVTTTQPPGFVPPTFATTTPRTPSSSSATGMNTTTTRVTFAPTSDILGNTIPSGPVGNIFPTSVPGAGRRTTLNPDAALQNLLVELGIEEEVAVGPVILSPNINRTIALCTLVKENQVPASIQELFADVTEQCDSINQTIPLREAAAFIQQEVTNILQNQQGAAPTPARGTRAPASNNLQNLLNLLPGNSNNGGSTGGGGLASLLGGSSGGTNSLLASALGGGSSGGTNSLLASALGGGSSGGTNSLLASVLGGGSSGGTNSLLTSALGGGNSNINALLSNILGGSTTTAAPTTNSPIQALLANALGGSNNGGSSNSLISNLLAGNSGSNNGGSSGITSLLASLSGGNNNNNGGSSSGLTNTLLQNLIQQQSATGSRAPRDQPIGAQLPDFIGTTPAPVYNPLLCELVFGDGGFLSSLTSGGSSLLNYFILPYRQNLLRQYGCLNSFNPLQLLAGGGGIDSLRDTLGPLLGLTSSTEDENIGSATSGPLDPSRIPPDILTRCLNERGTLNAQNNCKVGIHVNIRTAQECYNLGCVWADLGEMCFRCPYIPVSAQVNQQAQPTCNVPTSDRQRCPGFQTTFVISSIISQQQSLTGRSTTNTGSTNGVGLAPRSGPAPRQGIFGNLGGLTGGSSFSNQYLQRDCENRGCCWDPSTSVFSSSSSCFSQAQPTLPDSSADCLSSLTCGETRSGVISRIIGGQTQASEDRPWQAVIRFQGTNIVRCSGVIICSQWILTAASCLQKIQELSSVLGFAIDVNPSSLEVFVGTNDPTSGQTIAVDRIIPHPFFRVTQNIHDLALIQVNTLPFSLTVNAVCLPPFATAPIGSGVTVQVAGYGQSSATILQNTLKEITAVTYDYTLCKNIYQTSLPNRDVFCATPTNSQEDTCVGDGGSPALTYDSTSQTYTLVGIHFAGSSDCSGSSPMVFIDIAAYREWIRQTTNGCCSLVGGRTSG